MTTEHRPGLAETLKCMLVDHSLVTEHMSPHGVGMVDVKLPAALVAVVRAAWAIPPAADGSTGDDCMSQRTKLDAALAELEKLVDVGK